MELVQLWKIIQHEDITKLRKYCETMETCIVEDILAKVHKKSGDSAMHLMARHGQLEMLQHVRINYEAKLELLNLDKKTPLHEAASNCHTHIVKYLISQHVDVDPLKKAGWSPLMMACTKLHNLPVVILLVEAGADLNLKNKDGWNCFHIACRTGDASIVTYLRDKAASLCATVSNNSRTPLHTSALHGRRDVAIFLVNECGLKPSARDSCGSTALMDAVRGGNVDTIQVLASLEPNATEQTDKIGRNCLHIAAEAGQVTSLTYLLKRVLMDPNCRVGPGGVGSGQTPLHLAYKENHDAAVRALVECGASEEIADEKGRVPRDMVVTRYRRL